MFPICVVSTYNDSRKDLHKTCQIIEICQCKRLLVSSSAERRTFVDSLAFPEKFSFYMGATVSTELPSLVPLQRVDDCFEDPHPSLRTL